MAVISKDRIEQAPPDSRGGTIQVDPSRVVPISGRESGIRNQESDSLQWRHVLTKAFKSVPSSGMQYIGDILTPFIHPVETVKGLSSAALGAVEKIPGGAYLTPGPAYTQVGEPDRGEAIDAIIDFYKDRYSTTEGFKQAVATDPVGVLADVSTLFVGGGGVATGTAKVSGKTSRVGAGIAKTGALLEPINVLIAPARVAKLAILRPSVAPWIYKNAVKFQNKLTPDELNRLVKTGLEHSVYPTFKGMQKLEEKIDVLNRQIADMIDDAGKTGQNIKVGKLFRGFRDLKFTFSGEVHGKEKIAAVRKFQKDTTEQFLKYRKRGYITPAEAQAFKQSVYRDLQNMYYAAVKEPIPKRVQMQAAKNVRQAIEAIIPEIKNVNRKDGDLIFLRREIDASVKNISKRDMISIAAIVKGGAGGAIAGKAGAAIGTALGVLDSRPTLKARLAVLVYKMQKRGVNVRMTPAVMRLISHEAGQLSEEVQENTGE